MSTRSPPRKRARTVFEETPEGVHRASDTHALVVHWARPQSTWSTEVPLNTAKVQWDAVSRGNRPRGSNRDLYSNSSDHLNSIKTKVLQCAAGSLSLADLKSALVSHRCGSRRCPSCLLSHNSRGCGRHIDGLFATSMSQCSLGDCLSTGSGWLPLGQAVCRKERRDMFARSPSDHSVVSFGAEHITEWTNTWLGKLLGKRSEIIGISKGCLQVSEEHLTMELAEACFVYRIEQDVKIAVKHFEGVDTRNPDAIGKALYRDEGPHSDATTMFMHDTFQKYWKSVEIAQAASNVQLAPCVSQRFDPGTRPLTFKNKERMVWSKAMAAILLRAPALQHVYTSDSIKTRLINAGYPSNTALQAASYVKWFLRKMTAKDPGPSCGRDWCSLQCPYGPSKFDVCSRGADPIIFPAVLGPAHISISYTK